MSKESSHTEDGKAVRYLPYNLKNGPDDVVRHPGKTKRDHESGAWANHLANRAARGDESRGKK